MSENGKGVDPKVLLDVVDDVFNERLGRVENRLQERIQEVQPGAQTVHFPAPVVNFQPKIEPTPVEVVNQVNPTPVEVRNEIVQETPHVEVHVDVEAAASALRELGEAQERRLAALEALMGEVRDGLNALAAQGQQQAQGLKALAQAVAAIDFAPRLVAPKPLSSETRVERDKDGEMVKVRTAFTYAEG
jgi:hypothetical protein